MMANGFVFGKGGTPSGGGTVNGYECAVQHVPSQTLSFVGNISGNAAYSSTIPLEYPLIFPSRTIQDAQDFLSHLGTNGVGNIMFSGDGLASNQLVGKPVSGALNGVRVMQSGTGSMLNAFDLYIWAKFED